MNFERTHASNFGRSGDSRACLSPTKLPATANVDLSLVERWPPRSEQRRELRPFGTRTYYGSGTGDKQALESTMRAYREDKRRRQTALLNKTKARKPMVSKRKQNPALEQPDAADDTDELEEKIWFRFFDPECGMHYYATPTGDKVRWKAPSSRWMDAPTVMV